MWVDAKAGRAKVPLNAEQKIACAAQVGVLPGFLGEADRAALLAYVRDEATVWRRTNPQDSWDNRTIPISEARPDIQERLKVIRDAMTATVMGYYGLERALWSDGLCLVRWFPGNDQRPHADAANETGHPHPYPWRDYGAIAYLNTDFTGGRLYYPELELSPPIMDGMLAFHPGTVDFMHGVTAVTGGMRYTVASFLTHDASKRDWT
jgi:hypothetical protein